MREDRLAILSLSFCDPVGNNWKVRDFVIETYDRMLAQQRPCEMLVAVSHPLTRKQADLFNDQNSAVSKGVGMGAGLGFPASRLGLRTIVGAVAGFAAEFVLEPRHAGDVIVTVQARVEGGIGQQASSRGILIKAQGGRR